VVAGAVLGEDLLGRALRGHDHDALAVAERGLDRVVEALLHSRLRHQAVDHGLDRVLLLLVEPDLVLEGEDDPVHPHPGEARLAHGLDHVLVLALALLHEGGEEQELRARRDLRDLAHDLLRRLLRDLAAAVVAGQPAHPRPQHAQVIVDLRDRAHGGARVRGGSLLLDRDRGGEAADGVVERLVHLAEELAGVGVQALDVAALALRVEGVEGEARLARARDARDHHELLLRDLDGDVLEVVLARAGDDDSIEFHRRTAPVRAGADLRPKLQC
jgi:hypothetical protein